MTTESFIEEYREANIADVALRARQYPEVDAAFAVQQIEGWQRGRQKLPTLAAIRGWQWPVRLSLEQCSSELTARYKQSLVPADVQCGTDLTGGFGIDSFYLSEGMNEWHYVERQPDLCRVVEHNYAAAGRTNITIHNAEAETFLENSPLPQLGYGSADCESMRTKKGAKLFFLDPARRSESGGKVFRLEDCTPDLTQLYDRLMASCDVLMLKLSPMLDIQEALRHLPDARGVHVVSVKGEVKELLVICRKGEGLRYTAALLPSDDRFVFTLGEEQNAVCQNVADPSSIAYLYEPDSAILKAGAFRSIANRFGLSKLAPNTHVYASSEWVEGFPGRAFRVVRQIDKQMQKDMKGRHCNIITRNYPLKPEELKKKLRTNDGGEQYILGVRVGDKPVLFLCDRQL